MRAKTLRIGLVNGLLAGLLGLSLAGCDETNVFYNDIFTNNAFTPLRTMELAPDPQMPVNSKIYHAPAQTYDLDLSDQAFMGKLKMRQSCTPEGNSLSVLDQAGRFYRIDVINLKGNSKFPNADTLSIQDLSQQVIQYYTTLYNTYPATSPLQFLKSHVGAAGFGVLTSQQQLAPIGFLISKQGDYAYVLQHQGRSQNADAMLKTLNNLSAAMQIPGKQLKKSGTPLALSIDLAQATPAQLSDWKKTANCS